MLVIKIGLVLSLGLYRIGLHLGLGLGFGLGLGITLGLTLILGFSLSSLGFTSILGIVFNL